MKFFHKLFLIIISLFIFSCSQESPEEVPKALVPGLSSLTGGTIRLKTTDDPILVSSNLIYTDDGKLIADNISFKLVTETIKISLDNQNWSEEIVVKTKDGKFDFYLQSYNLVGLYRVNAYPISNEAIKFSQGINSRFFVDVVAGDPYSMGSIFSDQFEDLPPYNNVKDSNESWIINANPDLITYVGVGPVRDIHDNIINDGSINLSIDSGTITSENPTRVLSGYVYFSYKPDSSNGNLNLIAQLTHSSNVNLSLTEDFKKASPELIFLDQADFSNMLANETKCVSLRLKNKGSMAGTYLELSSLTPYQLIDESVDDPLCPITTDTCKIRQDLRSGEICKLRVKFTMPSTTISGGELTARVKPSEFASSIIVMPLRTQLIQSAQLISSNSFLSFGATQCASTRNIEMYVQNVGDFDATNITIQNPPPFTNQSQSFFTLTSPTADLNPSSNLNTVINCGTTFPAHRKCRILVSFNPTASAPNQAVSGRINSDNTSPLFITLSGYTIPGVAVGGFPISFITPNNSILPLGMGIQSGQRSTVNVGPIVDACSSLVSDGTIVNSSVTGGSLTSNVGVTNNGRVSFTWNSASDAALIGNQTFSANVGSQVANSVLQFRGVSLSLTGNTNLGEVIQEKPRTEIYTLTNNGNQIAQNLSISGSSPFVILDKGDCNSDSLNAYSSCAITVQAAPQNLNQDLVSVISASSNSIGINQTSINVTVKARTKAILTFDSSRYLFNNGSNSSVFSRTITLTNNGPATSNLTQVAVDSPFSIQSSNCPSTLNPNTSCQITVSLSSSDIVNVGGQKIYVINEIDNGSPFADLAFSELKFTNTEIKSLVGRCAGPFNLAVNGQTGAIDPSSNVVVSLGSSGSSADGLFYATSDCSGSPITQTTILSGSSQSNAFYFKSLIARTTTLLAQNANFPITGQNFQSKAEITLDQTLGLTNNEIYPILPSGGYGSYIITFSDSTLSSTYATLTDILDSNNNPSGARNLNIKNTLTSHQIVTIKVLDQEGFYKNFTIDLYPPVVGGSLTVSNANPVLVPYTDYGNLNAKTIELKHLSGVNYVAGSLYGSSIDSNGYYHAGSTISSATEYAFITIAKYTGGSSVAIVPITVNLQWPFGTLGDLVINSGQIVNLAAGQSYDYRSITINSGGTLNITGRGIILLGSVNNFVINGSITSDLFDECGSNFSLTDPDVNATASLTVSYGYSSTGTGGSGGNGPGGHSWNGGASGGAGCCGYGGGGGGGGGGSWSGGCCGMNYYGGTGGSCGGAGGYSFGAGNVYQFGYYGGAGMITYAQGGNASDGAVGGGSGGGAGSQGVFNNAPFGSHAGGGGGMKGFHRNSLFIRTKSSVTGSGNINLSGTNGFNGGTGGSPLICDFYQPGSGGGGGGGSGGSGGTVNIKYKISNLLPLSNINTNGGLKGAGGSQGFSCYSASANGTRGADGSNGSNGVISISLY